LFDHHFPGFALPEKLEGVLDVCNAKAVGDDLAQVG
jgi:hypothetical protein